MRPRYILPFLILLLGAREAGGLPQEKAESKLLKAMKAELDRSFTKLKTAGEAPLYFLAYRAVETESVDLTARYGALDDVSKYDRARFLDVELRVGDPKLDNTHKIRDEGFDFDSFSFGGPSTMLPLEDDEASIRTALWLATDEKFKAAQKRFTKVKANKSVKVEEEDTSDDFSVEKPQTYSGATVSLSLDRKAWEDRVRRLSAVYREFPAVHSSSFSLSATATRRCLVTSEGTAIQDGRVHFRASTYAQTTADDGMRLWLYDAVDATTPGEIPDEKRLEQMVRDLAKSLGQLRTAPVAEPYAGPAILRPKAAGVFFHEIFGHRIEGHRQKDEEEGRTFAKKIGQKVMPEFISVYDDPTRERLGKTPLNGFFRFDDEGVPAQKVTLVEKGTLKTFLLGRSPVKNFPNSNAHGRCSPGNQPVARQGNLIVEADPSKRVPYAKLKEMLVEEAKRQGKEYGLIFDDIAGGFTYTGTFLPQAFKVQPLRVLKVYADGRSDEVLRGVDIAGTPLASLERILWAADDVDVFNGTCGAESGWVPVSASAPSLLVETIEVERQEKSQDKPPLLPAPRHDPEDPGKSTKKEG